MSKTDGLKAVAADPIAYLPDGKDRVVSAYNDNLTLVTRNAPDVTRTGVAVFSPWESA